MIASNGSSRLLGHKQRPLKSHLTAHPSAQLDAVRAQLNDVEIWLNDDMKLAGSDFGGLPRAH